MSNKKKLSNADADWVSAATEKKIKWQKRWNENKIESLKKYKAKKQKEPRKPIHEISIRQAGLKEIYQIIRPGYLSAHSRCAIGLPGCTMLSTEIHHSYVRTGYYLIESYYFRATCRNCHHIVTVDSKMAVENGFSHPRTVRMPHILTPTEVKLLQEREIPLPIT